jgi:hypothetical protein
LCYIEAHSSYVISTPVIAHFLTKPFIILNLVGLPFQAPKQIEEEKAPKHSSGNRINILHAPTYPIGKGSPIIRTVIEKLRQKGHNIEFIEITGRPHAEVIQAIQRCDFVVDEIYNTTAMGGLAVEATFFGKPSVVGGYCWDYLRGYIPSELFPPSQICYPQHLEAAIEELITDPAKRLKIGLDAQMFVRDYWSPKVVAQRFIHIIEGQVPISWYFDPQDIRYLHGWGLSEDTVRQNLRLLVKEHGLSGLGLDDKPGLIAALEKFIQQG